MPYRYLPFFKNYIFLSCFISLFLELNSEYSHSNEKSFISASTYLYFGL